MATKTEIVFSILIVMTALSIFYGLLGSFTGEEQGVETQKQSNNVLGFGLNIITGIESMPWWFNTLIFGTIISGVVWLIVSSLPTLSGGS